MNWVDEEEPYHGQILSGFAHIPVDGECYRADSLVAR